MAWAAWAGSNSEPGTGGLGAGIRPSARKKGCDPRMTDVPTHTGKHKCPKCSHLRTNKTDKSLSVHYDNGEKFFKCHHCEWKGKLDGGSPMVKNYRRPEFIPDTPTEKLVNWFARRGIPKRVLERNKITPTERFGKRVIAFPYYREEQLINVKYRTDDKQFSMEGECELVLYGMDDIDAEVPLIFVEGEIDKLSVETAGYTNCVSVPNGAGTNLDLLAAAERWLEPVTKFIWAGDNDEAGRRLESEAIRRLGPERCYRVQWPTDCKDANDVLLMHGSEILAEAIDQARPVPIEGAFEVYDLMPSLERLYQLGRPRGEHPGWDSMANYYRPRSGDWTVVTGSPGSGKTVFLAALMVNLARLSNWQFVVYPPENLPPEEYLSMLLEIFLGMPFNEGPNRRMTQSEMTEAAGWAQEHFILLNPTEDARSLGDLLALTRSYVYRRGINGLVIDPWNEIEHTMLPGQTETQYICESLIRIRSFTRLNGLHTWVVVHPTKLAKENGRYPVATLYDCSGSAHWFNKCDMGLSIYRDKSNDAEPVEVHIQKVRFRWSGQIGMVPLHYDKVTGRYYEVRPPLQAVGDA